MIVNRIAQFDNKYAIPKNQPSFGSLYHGLGNYYDDKGVRFTTQTSTCIRGDVSLNDFVDTIGLRFWKFKKIFGRFKRINILPMCVSDGTEAYAFSNAIIRKEGLENFKKNYRVIASDIVPDIINNYPQNGLLFLYKNEEKIFNGIGIKALEEVKQKCTTKDGCNLYQLSDEYRKLFKFHVEDLEKRIRGLKDEGNSIIIIRNSLRDNFSSNIARCVISDLAKKMKGGSILITGDYDRKEKYIKNALKEDFVELSHNIWGLKKYGIIRNYLTKFLLLCMKI